MKITYIGHSGFLAELEQLSILFDYYRGELPDLSKDKKLYVCSSHRHEDHFNPDIFKLQGKYPQVEYLLSHDIWPSRVPKELLSQTVFLKPDCEWKDSRIQVETLQSTDEGVAFFIQAEGQMLYHAGDLNNWQWEGEAEEWNRKMERDFKAFLDPLRGKKIDAAFIPLDPRQEKNYSLGMDYFLELTDTKRIYPMHCWNHYSIIERWLSEHSDSRFKERIVKISSEGEVFEQ